MAALDDERQERAEEVSDLREQLRVADADRVPLAMDVQTMNVDLTRLKLVNAAMNALCDAAQTWEPTYRAAHADGLPSSISAASAKLADAIAVYESAMSEISNDNDLSSYARIEAPPMPPPPFDVA